MNTTRSDGDKIYIAVPYWSVGATLSLLATFLGTAGKLLLRYGEQVRARGQPRRAFFVDLTGLSCNAALGPVFDFMAYGFAPQSLLAPISGMDVIWNLVAAPCTLGEKLTQTRVGGALLICFGTAVTAIFGAHDEPEYTAAVLKELISSPNAVLYYALSICAISACLRQVSVQPLGSVRRGLGLGCAAGFIAGNMFATKASVELLQRAPSTHWRTFITPFPYAMFALAIFFACTNLRFLTKAMREYEALFMVVVFEGSMVLANSLCGGMVLGEFGRMSRSQFFFYTVGMAVVFGGLFSLGYGEARRKARKILPQTDSDSDIEEPAQAGLPSAPEEAAAHSHKRVN